MDALSLLLNRHSQPALIEPAPGGEELDNILQAALKAPDHAGLKPWRFIVCEGNGLNKLAELYTQSAIANQKTEQEINRAGQLPHRAPMVVVAIMKYTEHAKVPRVEQISSAACSVMAMQMAALAQGFNGMWRTGSYAYCNIVKEGLGLAEKDEVVGFLYLGTPKCKKPSAPPLSAEGFVSYWR